MQKYKKIAIFFFQKAIKRFASIFASAKIQKIAKRLYVYQDFLCYWYFRHNSFLFIFEVIVSFCLDLLHNLLFTLPNIPLFFAFLSTIVNAMSLKMKGTLIKLKQHVGVHTHGFRKQIFFCDLFFVQRKQFNILQNVMFNPLSASVRNFWNTDPHSGTLPEGSGILNLYSAKLIWLPTF